MHNAGKYAVSARNHAADIKGLTVRFILRTRDKRRVRGIDDDALFGGRQGGVYARMSRMNVVQRASRT